MNNLQIMRKPLRNLLLVNWSRFGAEKIKIEGSTLFTGVNGSGKSTLLDAMTYLISGNSSFNIAAQDKDRTVLGYVRGDTKSNGEYRYLRKGEIVSYIAMEFDSPVDRSHFVVGVCIESRDEKTFKSWCFVRNHASLDDFNFYEQDGTHLSVTPHNLLSCKKEKLRSQDFMPKEQGVKQVLRMMGLRCDWKEYRSKLIKMMAFKQENHIDHFIRECVLPERPITTIPHLQEQKKKYTELLITYENLLKQKEQLNVVEAETVRFETVQRNVFLKWILYHYQNWQTAEHNILN